MAAPVLAAVSPVTRDLAPVRFAAAVAGCTGAPLLIAAVEAREAEIDRLVGGQLGEDLPRVADAALEEICGTLAADGIEAEALALGATSAPRGLELAAQEAGAGLIVIGSLAAGRPNRVLPGPTADRLLNGAPCAVALVPRRWQRTRDLHVIGAAFADTVEGRAAVRSAHTLAHRSGARLRVLAAIRPLAWMDGEPKALAEDLRARAEQAAGAAISGLVGAPVDVDVIVADPERFLLEASAHVDLLVCGARGYGPGPAVLLGGVTRALTSSASCPVIVLAHGAPAGLEALEA
jgi:nucleotide-binding universal stress UspA family protein